MEVMKPRLFVLLLVAVGCGLVAALLTSKLAQGHVKKVPVLVANKELRQGQFIGADPKQLFHEEEKPEESVIAGTVTDINDLKNKTLQRTVDEGSPILRRDLSENEGLDRNLPEGYRAMTIRVTQESCVGGFVGPGSFVDLIANHAQPNQPGQRRSKIFLQNMQVLALNTEDRAPDGSEKRAAQTPQVITLAVKPADAEKISWLASAGSPLYMVKRKPGDKTYVPTTGVSSFEADGPDEAERGVVVARRRISGNIAVTQSNLKDYFEMRQVRLKDALSDAYTNLNALVGKTVHLPMSMGQQVTDTFLANPERKAPEIRYAADSYDLTIYNGPSVTSTPMTVAKSLPGYEKKPRESGSEGK
jgi:pilus assembly protein CpaB